RAAQESLVAMLPGQVLGSFTDSMLAPRPNGMLIFARGEEEVAVLFVPYAGAAAPDSPGLF
ncbi:MAG TPA: hypothetical protein PLT07_07620, partial [Trueperaceae bacterium]|nr:hypothetical protein [Trueperaceae bacterium]